MRLQEDQMYEDEILREVWRAKDAVSAKFDYHIDKMFKRHQRGFASLRNGTADSAQSKEVRRPRTRHAPLSRRRKTLARHGTQQVA